MDQPPTIPVTVIAGYLGAGKTTLLNHILAHQDTSRYAILVNDFGVLNIDAELIEMQGGQAFRLENGCICCNVGNSLMATLLSILRSQPRPARILIEASGVANPSRIADIARLSPSLSLDRVVVLVDCERIRDQIEDSLVGETVRVQLEGAELLLLNKQDLVSPAYLAELRGWLATHFEDKQILDATFGEVPLAIVLPPARELAAASSPPTLPSSEVSDHDEEHETPARHAPADHDHTFWSWSFETAKQFRRAALEDVLLNLPTSIARAKGIVLFHEAPTKPMIVQLSGKRLSIAEAGGALTSPFVSRLVFIGVGDKPKDEDLAALVSSALCAASASPKP